MTNLSKTPERANDVARPGFGLDIVSTILDRGPKLTKSWRPFRAFVVVMTALTTVGLIIRPEVAPYLGAIFLIALVFAFLAAHKKLLD